MKRRPLRTAVVAGALTLSTVASGVSIAGAAAPRPHAVAHRTDGRDLRSGMVPRQLEHDVASGVDTVRRLTDDASNPTLVAAATTRIVADDTFSLARYVETRDGVPRVVFVVRNLTTGTVRQLNT